MKQFQITVNGQSLAFSQDQIPHMQKALEDAISKPGVTAVQTGKFGEIRAVLSSRENHQMTNSQVELTDC
jgi:hypothetical protein